EAFRIGIAAEHGPIGGRDEIPGAPETVARQEPLRQLAQARGALLDPRSVEDRVPAEAPQQIAQRLRIPGPELEPDSPRPRAARRRAVTQRECVPSPVVSTTSKPSASISPRSSRAA